MECKDVCIWIFLPPSFVLIETLWNVKQPHPLIQYSDGRINRNIVECKDQCKARFFVDFSVLIETLWNVKNASNFGLNCVKHVLIETLWNVKEVVKAANKFLDSVLIETLWNVKNNEFDEEYFEFGY